MSADARANRPIRSTAAELVCRLRRAGHVAYFVGGCVRDRLLGLEPTEYDIATDAVPEEVRGVFPGAHLVGESFGVMLVRSHGHVIEVATFRSEGRSSDHRHPDAIEFTNEREDVKRRDFTINGMFENPEDGRVVDYVGGQNDIKARCLRAIGDPTERFVEDHLRMLRAVRFAARFDLEIDSPTAAAIQSQSGSLSGISSERVGQELRRMFTGGPVLRAVQLLAELGLDVAILGDAAVHAGLSRCAHIDERDPAPSLSRFEPALAAWLLDRYGIESLDFTRCESVGDQLVCSNQERARLQSIVMVYRMIHCEWETLSIARKKRLAASPVFAVAVTLIAADQREHATAIEAEVEILAATPSGLAPVPLVMGQDLIDAGIDPGPGFGFILDAIYDAQLEDQLSTSTEGVLFGRAIVDSGSK